MQLSSFTNLTASQHWLKAVHFTVQLSVIATVANNCYMCAISSGNDTVMWMTGCLSNRTAHLWNIAFTTSGNKIRSIQDNGFIY